MLNHEQEIIWLHPPDRYDYLRETTTGFNRRRGFPKNMHPTGQTTDGGDGTHLVAYSVLKSDAPSTSPYLFERRYWWVKSYDRFQGHGTDPGGSFYTNGGPAEAVLPQSIHAGKPSKRGWNP